MFKLTFFSSCKKKNKSNVEIIEENCTFSENLESNMIVIDLAYYSYQTEIQFENPIP